MGDFAEYADFDGLGLADLIRRKEVTPSEVLEAAFALIDKLNPKLNAIVASMRPQAERDIATGLADGPFTGVPIVLKDEYLSYAGFPASMASRLGQGFTRPYDSELIRRYKRAGLVITAKANLPEFGASVTTEPVANGRCNNPWNPDRTTGGSSGGSAAAVASGMVPLGYANDGAGSIRIPASCCGIFGLKPTRARVPTGPDGGEYWNGLVIEHAVTRSVRDSAALLDATEGADPGAPYWAPPKARPYREEAGRDPGRLRIAFSDKPPSDVPVAAQCREAMQEAARLCADLGHHVEEAAPVFDGDALCDAITRLLMTHLAAGIDDLARVMNRPASPDIIERANFALAEQGRKISATEFLGILEHFSQVSRQVAPFFEKYDLLLTPTLASPPVEHGYITSDDPDWRRYVERFFAFVPFTPIANVTGNPAMTLPLHWSQDGLPVGVHFIGRFGDEATLFRLAGQLEAARPWKDRHPAISAWT
jgi:amidase